MHIITFGECMSWSDLLKENSSIAKAVDLVGDRWSLMMLAGCFSGVCRFNQFEYFLGINRNLLSARLDKLVDSGLLERRLYNESPQRYEYQLTEIASELRPIIIGLAAWAERHYTQEDSPFTIVHKECKQKVEIATYCKACDSHVHNADVATKVNSCAGPEALRLFASMAPTSKIEN